MKILFTLPLVALFACPLKAKADFFSCNYSDDLGYTYPLDSEYDNNDPKGLFHGVGWYNMFESNDLALAAAKYSCEKNSPSKASCELSGCSRT